MMPLGASRNAYSGFPHKMARLCRGLQGNRSWNEYGIKAQGPSPWVFCSLLCNWKL